MAHNFNYDDYKISSKMDWKEVESEILKEEKRNLRIQQRIMKEVESYDDFDDDFDEPLDESNVGQAATILATGLMAGTGKAAHGTGKAIDATADVIGVAGEAGKVVVRALNGLGDILSPLTRLFKSDPAKARMKTLKSLSKRAEKLEKKGKEEQAKIVRQAMEVISKREIEENRNYIFRHPDRENQDSLSAEAAKDRFLVIISDAAGGHDDTYIHHLDTHAPIDATMLADAFEAMTDHANLFSNTLKKSLGSGRETSRWESTIKPQIEKIVQRFPEIYGEVEQFISAVEANKQENLSEGCAGGVCTIGGGSPSSSSSQYNGARIGSLRAKAPKVKRSSVVVMEDIDGVTREVVVTDVSEDIKEGRAGFKGFWLEDPSKVTWGFNEDIKVVMGTLESLLEMEIREDEDEDLVEGEEELDEDAAPGCMGGTGSPAIARAKLRVGEKVSRRND